uniref:Uncharacterized protein n=1 Tax=Rhizophora mucronata TaxID=61149 RepID=A0A2P2PMS9_RHIMU
MWKEEIGSPYGVTQITNPMYLSAIYCHLKSNSHQNVYTQKPQYQCDFQLKYFNFTNKTQHILS